MDQQAMKHAVIEVLGRDGRVLSVQRIEHWPARVGRSPACEVVLDDAHVAAEHAELQWGEGAPELELLPSINGGWQGKRQLKAGDRVTLAPDALIQLGNTQLRWRSTQSALAPELPLAAHQQRMRLPSLPMLVSLMVLWLGLNALERWLDLEPGSRLIEYSTPLLGGLAAVLVWAAAWSLVTQLFQHRFPFSVHLARALKVLLVAQLLSYALPGIAFSLSWPSLMALEGMVFTAAAAGLIWWHSTLVWPRVRLATGSGLAALVVLSLGLQAERNIDSQHWFGPPYLTALPMPALRLAKPVTPTAFVDSVRPLEAQLKSLAKKDEDQAGGGDD